MTIIQVLLGEHGAIYPLFDEIENTAESMNLAGLKLQARLLESSLVSHADLEDALLRPEIRRFLPPPAETADGSPAPTDHQVICSGLKRVLAASTEEEARLCLLNTIANARKHFREEEAIIFSVARREISTKRQRELAVEWARRRGVFLG